MRTKIVLLTSLFVGVLLTGCVSKSKIVYLNGINNQEVPFTAKEITLQPDDALSIMVNSENPEITMPYNTNTTENKNQTTYLIDKEGNINFPIIGTIKVGGLTRIQAQQKIQNILKEHIADATIEIRIQNFKVTIMGDVASPGAIAVQGERITLLEAIGQAGDLSIQGVRKNVLLIREKEGKRITKRIDLTDPDLIQSEYYYLAQNDVVYVEPNKTKINSSVVGPNLTLGFSAASLLLAIISLTLR